MIEYYGSGSTLNKHNNIKRSRTMKQKAMNYIIKTLTKGGKEKTVRVTANNLKEALTYLTEYERKHISSWVGWQY